MTEDHTAFGQTLCARRADVVLPHDLQHLVPRQPYDGRPAAEGHEDSWHHHDGQVVHGVLGDPLPLHGGNPADVSTEDEEEECAHPDGGHTESNDRIEADDVVGQLILAQGGHDAHGDGLNVDEDDDCNGELYGPRGPLGDDVAHRAELPHGHAQLAGAHGLEPVEVLNGQRPVQAVLQPEFGELLF